MGATADGHKELIALTDGYRESEQSWLTLLVDVKQRGLKLDPKLATGDGALGFWKALPQMFPTTREQRCWVHKTANVLDKLPKRLQPAAKEQLHQIWMAATRLDAQQAFDTFLETYRAKYPKAVECLQKDRDVLLAFYDFPAEHWIHLRTTNPIESTFATVRLRHRKTKGNGTRKACLTMVYKLMESAAKRWRLLNGSNFLPEVIAGVNSSTESNPKSPPPKTSYPQLIAISHENEGRSSIQDQVVSAASPFSGSKRAISGLPSTLLSERFLLRL